MSTHSIIGLVVGALVIVAGVLVLLGKAPQAPQTGDAHTQEAGQKNTGSGSLKSLFGMTGTFKCTISSDVPSGLASGEIHVSNGKVRGDFTTQVQGATVAAHMIQTDGYMYNWSDAFPQGVKIKVDAVTTANGAPASMDMFDANANINYSCEPVSADQAMFTPPANITFMDIGALPKIPSIPTLQ